MTPEEKSVALQAWLFLANVNTSLGRWPEAAHACDEAVKLAPTSPEYRARAAAAWLRAGRPDTAVDDLQLALARNDDPQLRFALAEATFRQNVRAPKGSRNWQAVQAALLDVRSADAKQPLKEPWRLQFLEAEFAKARRDDEGRQADGVREAASIYRNIKLDEKSERTVLPAIAVAFERLGLHDDADGAVTQWEKMVTPQQARMFRAQMAASRKKYDEARRLAQIDLDKLPPAEKSSAQRFLVRVSLAEGDWQKARAGLDAVTDLGPRDLDLLFAYAELADGKKQPAELEFCRQKFIEIDGTDSRYAKFLAASDSLAQAGTSASRDGHTSVPQLRDAEAMVERLHDQYPEWPAGLLLRAAIARRSRPQRRGHRRLPRGNPLRGGRRPSVRAIDRPLKPRRQKLGSRKLHRRFAAAEPGLRGRRYPGSRDAGKRPWGSGQGIGDRPRPGREAPQQRCNPAFARANARGVRTIRRSRGRS